jgi:hypothetical protein
MENMSIPNECDYKKSTPIPNERNYEKFTPIRNIKPEFYPPPRTEMKCRICGQFSSAQTCWSCCQHPATFRLTVLEQKVREYLSTHFDRRRKNRQGALEKIRQELKELVTYETPCNL